MSRLLGDDWLLPLLDDDNREWFTAGRMVFRACSDCGAVQHPPDDVCGSCQGSRFTQRPSAGRGRVETVATVHHPVHPALADHVPYAIVVVSVDDVPGAHVVGNVVDDAPGVVGIGDPVEVVFEQIEAEGETLRIPQWRRIGASGGS